MIRAVLLLWAAPLGFFWGWYFLSLHDLSFGILFFSREFHDQFFHLYGSILGIDPAVIPGMVAKAIAVDSLFVLALVAFRKRHAIARFVRERRGTASYPASGLAESDRSLSSAP